MESPGYVLDGDQGEDILFRKAGLIVRELGEGSLGVPRGPQTQTPSDLSRRKG